MIRACIETLGEAIAIGLSIAVIIGFAAVGCMLNKRDAYTSHNVKGFRAAVVSQSSPNR